MDCTPLGEPPTHPNSLQSDEVAHDLEDGDSQHVMETPGPSPPVVRHTPPACVCRCKPALSCRGPTCSSSQACGQRLWHLKGDRFPCSQGLALCFCIYTRTCLSGENERVRAENHLVIMQFRESKCVAWFKLQDEHICLACFCWFLLR